ncbi:4-hydroxy-tetrahydrodipicolinate reductase [Fructobacillus sp. M2-14]|uniref:4-hydroxy-tetrahydrodipicolinate reductase n=1 Tax=Fructobacillus broussonetiae TaxID=2713173 RepID=A0ABS5QYB7_9LACO|nr:4-hydroxy-tetrahydrodipicolinate reductase [Fructobacillus broussonetiae]MBS9338184.1 4-hydroxy-tetrahydrodipicolinate reductase [Fructobacillus broussonetiae]
MIRVIVAGYNGSMGRASLNMLSRQQAMEVVGVYSPNRHDVLEGVSVFQSLEDIDVEADVWLDFTTPDAVYENAHFAIDNGLKPIIGTTGLTDDQIAELQAYSKERSVSGLIVPNFSMSAVLLMKFSKEAARYFQDVEVIEMHHEDKKDTPSGTALSTAKRIDAVRKQHEQGNSKETLPGARGADYNGIRIHSVRLPGYVAHEQVLFGGEGEALTIRQDSFNRSSFMSGVALAIEKVDQVDGLQVGLETVM